MTTALRRREARRRRCGRAFARGRALVVSMVLGVALLAGCGDEPPPGERTSSPVPGFEYEACFDPGSRTPYGPEFGETDLRVRSDDGVGRTCVAVADTPAARSQGYRGVRDMQGFGGMLFVFEEEVDSAFTMRDTPMPLSIAFFDSDGALVSTLDMDPCLEQEECPSYRAEGPYRFALEMPQGRLSQMAITDDSARLVLDG